MKVLITGADGFLGWHLRCRLGAMSEHDVVPVGRQNWSRLPALVAESDAIVHLAGINRAPTGEELLEGNIQLARELAGAMRAASKPYRLIYAGTTQIGNGTPYGIAKEISGGLLDDAVETNGGSFCEVRLPGVFGEHARPNYNTFVATFGEAVLEGREDWLTVQDSVVELLHAQDAAATIEAALTSTEKLIRPSGHSVSVQDVLKLLGAFHTLYINGEIPDLRSPFELSLFNTYRSINIRERYPIFPKVNADARGELSEILRAHGRAGQTFISSTRPGQTRGEHYHLRKIERFAVVRGSARISMRRLLTNETIEFDVDADTQALVDMPTLWVHNIKNTGSADLLTVFWTDQLYDPSAPDTYYEMVRSPGGVSS